MSGRSGGSAKRGVTFGSVASAAASRSGGRGREDGVEMGAATTNPVRAATAGRGGADVDEEMGLGRGRDAEDAASAPSAQAAKLLQALAGMTRDLVTARAELGSPGDTEQTRARRRRAIQSATKSVEALRSLIPLLGDTRGAPVKMVRDIQDGLRRFEEASRAFMDGLKTVPVSVPARGRGGGATGAAGGGGVRATTVASGEDDDVTEADLELQRAEAEIGSKLAAPTVTVAYELALERAEATEAIVQDAVELNQIVKDLAYLVHEDSAKIEEIVANVEDTKESVVKGNENLGAANELQQSFRKKICFVLIIVLVVLALISIPIIIKVT